MSRRERRNRRDQRNKGQSADAPLVLWPPMRPLDHEHTDGADPMAGIISPRALYGKHARGRPWSWDPAALGPPIHVRGDGHHTAHSGTGGDSMREDPLEAEMRQANLTPNEKAVTRLRTRDEQGRRMTYVEIAAATGLSFWQVQRLVPLAEAKLQATRKATRVGGMAK